MKKLLLGLVITLFTFTSFSQDDGCFSRLQSAFNDRGSNGVSDDMHRNVYVCFFEDGESYCVSGKTRVENGVIVSVFLMYEDNTYELMDQKFFNAERESPQIVNGISEMIYKEDGEKFKVVFIDQLKPKKKGYKTISIPDDL